MRRTFCFALLAAGLALPAAPASADEMCFEYTPGSVIFARGIGQAYLVVNGPGSLSVTPTDCL